MQQQLGALLPSLLYLHHAQARVMNAGGVPYRISNPDSAAAAPYSTDFEANVAGPVEHFDMYGEVRTIYSQTYWTRNAPIPLPEELVKRFANGGVMAITGYEIDQVTHDNAPRRLRATSWAASRATRRATRVTGRCPPTTRTTTTTLRG